MNRADAGMQSTLARRAHITGGLLAACALLLGGCGGQNTLSPHATPARDIATLWWWMLGVAGTVLGGTLFLLWVGYLRRKKPGLPLFGKREKISTALVVGFGIGIPIAVNIALFIVGNFVVAQATEAPNTKTTPITIHVIGHQWFWEVRYPGTQAVTANEIHIPVGTRVNVVATTGDVIHSFWVPELNRKIDMIPGHPNRVLLEADKPGRYRGQCAEFCGAQHSHMALYVDADPPAKYKAWLAHMASPRVPPATPLARRGEQVFDQQACASCHTIRGTPAQGRIGPDLTHVGTRSTLAALTIPNRPGYLAGWILDPQHVKPGNRMPGLNLSNDDFKAVLAYVEGLK